MRKLAVEYIGVERPINGNHELCTHMLSFHEIDGFPRHNGSAIWMFKSKGKWWILPRTNSEEPFQAGPFHNPTDAYVHLKLISE